MNVCTGERKYSFGALLLLSTIVFLAIGFRGKFRKSDVGIFAFSTTPNEKYYRQLQLDLPEVTVVTGFSDNHFEEGMDLLKNAANLSDHINLVVYNLGLTSENVESLSDYIAYQSNIELRDFDFNAYPEFVSHLREYRWKPLIIQECIEQFEDILWLDASMRFCPDFADEIQKVQQFARSNVGIVIPGANTHSIFSATHPSMFKYYPMSEGRAKRSPMTAADVIFVHSNTKAKQLIQTWVQCALDVECMAPEGAELSCDFENDRWFRYGGCHRFDQSALSLILANGTDNDSTRYFKIDFLSIYRQNQDPCP